MRFKTRVQLWMFATAPIDAVFAVYEKAALRGWLPAKFFWFGWHIACLRMRLLSIQIMGWDYFKPRPDEWEDGLYEELKSKNLPIPKRCAKSRQRRGLPVYQPDER